MAIAETAVTTALTDWYKLPTDAVAERLGVEVGVGLCAAERAARLSRYGENSLPAEEPPPGWRRWRRRRQTCVGRIPGTPCPPVPEAAVRSVA